MSELEVWIRDSNITPFERLVRLMQVLRSEDGCAWDRDQTHKSLLPYLLEETYEVLETVEEDRIADLAEELGDLQIQILFHAQIARERGDFQIDDCLTAVLEKLISRHPHVFGDKKAHSPDEVRGIWEKIKIASKEKKSVLGGVPKNLPALTMAFRIGEKAAGVGFDWDHHSQVFDKIAEEIAEVRAELETDSEPDHERLASEIGDLLFAVASLARKLGVDPEIALRSALHKFKHRFDRLERAVNADKGAFEQYTLDQLERIWQSIKLENPDMTTD